MLRRRLETWTAIAGLALRMAGAEPIHAQTLEPPVNVPLCTEAGDQEITAVGPDTQSGAFVAWLDRRSSSDLDLYVQRITAEGEPAAGWPLAGAPVRVGAIDPGPPAVVADDWGGVFVAWRETRGSSPDVVTQHLDAFGRIDPRWPADGLVVCGADGVQSDPVLVTDGRGGAFVVWTDYRLGLNSDIYAHRILPHGAFEPVWPQDGLALCVDEAPQRNPAATADGRGGLIVAWEDGRSSDYTDIWAQRVPSTLGLAWGATGLEVCYAEGDQQLPKLAPDGEGGAFIVWQDRRGLHYDLYAKRIPLTGFTTPGWSENGNVVCAEPGGQYEPQIVSDGAGGALYCWFDDRNGGFDIYAQRLGALGAPSPGWTLLGVPICTAIRDQVRPHLASDEESGAYIAWTDRRATSHTDVYAQRITGLGIVPGTWPANGIAVSAAPHDQSTPLVAGNGRGRALVGWSDARSNTSLDVYAAALVLGTTGAGPTGDGARASAEVGEQSNGGLSTARWVAPDGAGGVYLAWEERHGQETDVVVQRIGTDAAPVGFWPAGGVVVGAAPGDQTRPTLAADGAGGVFVAWQDERDAIVGMHVYVQRLDANGQVVQGWPAGGLAVRPHPGMQMAPVLVADGIGGIYVAWVQRSEAGHTDIWAMRLTHRGQPSLSWTFGGNPACDAVLDQQEVVMVGIPTGGVLLFWSDARGSGGGDVFGIGLQPDSSIRGSWPADGVSIAAMPGRQYAPVAVEDGLGGAFVAWLDRRSTNAAPYLMRMTSTGSRVVGWPSGGVRLAAAFAGEASTLRLAATDEEQAIAAWSQLEGATPQLRLQRIEGNGTPTTGWPEAGIPASADPGPKLFPCLASTQAGGAFVTWIDLRNGAPDVWSQHLEANGQVSSHFLPTGRPLCTATGVQTAPALASNGAGRVFVAWNDHRGGTDDIYATGLAPEQPVTSVLDPPMAARRTVRLVAEPNPFRDRTRVDLHGMRPEGARIDLEVFDVAGARVRRLGRGSLQDGVLQVEWDGRTDAGRPAPAGIYFVRARGGGVVALVKLVRTH